MTDLPDSTGLTLALPGGGAAVVIGSTVIERTGSSRRGICRRCGRELAAWRAGEDRPALRCGCSG